MKNPTSNNVLLAMEVLVQGLQDDPDYALQWVHAIAKPFIAAGMPEPRAYTAAGNFMHENLRTFVFNHKDMPPCQAAVNQACGVLQRLGWTFQHDAWQPPVIGFDLASGSDKSAIVVGHHDEKGSLVIDEVVTFDEKRADVIGQNGNDGEHYDAIEKSEDAVTFKALADKVEPPAPGLRRSADPKPRPALALPDTNGMTDPSGRPNWSDIKSCFKWLAQDRRGVWKAFTHKPEPSAGRWVSSKPFTELNSGEPAFAQDYTETLEQRP